MSPKTQIPIQGVLVVCLELSQSLRLTFCLLFRHHHAGIVDASFLKRTKSFFFLIQSIRQFGGSQKWTSFLASKVLSYDLSLLSLSLSTTYPVGLGRKLLGEIAVDILRFLNVKDLHAAERVSIVWREAVMVGKLWEKLFKRNASSFVITYYCQFFLAAIHWNLLIAWCSDFSFRFCCTHRGRR